MTSAFQRAFIAGVERVTAWAELLDAINVYPVADGDTGRNLVISLSPLRRLNGQRESMTRMLLLSARGNSGNIAGRFLSAFIRADALEQLLQSAEEGRRRAWLAVREPRPGTMLTLFDVLVTALRESSFLPVASTGKEGKPVEKAPPDDWGKKVLMRLEEAVRLTPTLLPRLAQAGVVDAGALGMFLYFEGFFHTLLGMGDRFRPIPVVFKDQLAISSSFHAVGESGYCVDAVLNAKQHADEAIRSLSAMSDSIVVTRDTDYLKVHLHTEDREQVRRCLSEAGKLLAWSDDDLVRQTQDFEQSQKKQALHIVTDAAGSVTRDDVKKLAITLLDSYITSGGTCLPETHLKPRDVYAGMRRGEKVATSQASIFERHQLYDSVLSRYDRVLYLCVGSVFTGNYHVAMDWKHAFDPDDRMLVLDTGAASGRLGLTAIACARLSLRTDDPATVTRFARQAIECCEEVIFPDTLQYLAAGGRLSRTGAFLGDMLRMKPVISPLAEGAKKVGMVKNREEQIRFALDAMARSMKPDAAALIMLEYSDNETWVADTVEPEIRKCYPRAEIMLQPLSLTTGVHTGPGTWAAAFLPDIEGVS